MLWSGTRPGDTMADLIFCLAFLRLQMTLEERLSRRGIVNVTASARKGIFGGQHEEDCTSLFNPTFMDDLAVLVEGDTPEQMLAKLASALLTVKEVCQENALTLNMSAGKTEAIVLLQGKQAKEMKRCMFAEGEEDAAILETPAGPLRVVGCYRHLGCRVDGTRTQNAELAAKEILSLGYSVLGDRAIPTNVRTCVARSTIHSRLLHQAGKWTCLDKTQLHFLHEVHGASETHSGPAQACPSELTECETTRFCRRSRCHHWKPSWRLTSCGWQLKSRHRSKRCPWWSLLLEWSGGRNWCKHWNEWRWS